MSELPVETPIPPVIAAGIVKVMGNVKRLARLDENKFAHYNYTSIDTFLEAMGPLLAEAGIFILPEEESLEIIETEKRDREGTSAWLRMRWAFTIGHASGVSYGPLHRSVTVPASGAQAYGSSQSYALKQFIRGLFQVPTGDRDDPDSQDKEPLPKQLQPSNGNSKSSESAHRADAWRALEEADTPKELLQVAIRIRDSDAFSEETKTDLLNFARERMNDFACRTIKAVTTIEAAEKSAKFYGGMWLLTGEEKTRIVSALGAVREELEQKAKSDANAAPAAA
jgi:hypothetical protein